MVIISKTILNEFAQQHPDVANALNEWYDIVSHADWQSFADVKQTFIMLIMWAINGLFLTSKVISTVW